MSYVIGIDIGTQSIRTCVFSDRGTKVAQENEAFSRVRFPRTNYAEQDPNEWWQATLKTLSRIAQNPRINAHEIVALCIASTSCTVVVLDRQGNPLYPGILWMDHRAIAEADDITNTHNPVLKYSGNHVSPEWMLPKLAWLMKHEPEVFKKAYRIVEQADYINYHLTGNWSLSYNNLVAKWNYANPVGGWPEHFLESIGLSEARIKWPTTIHPVTTPIGCLNKKVAKATGLPESVLVVQGGIDSHAGVIGLSAIRPGEIGIALGTSTVVMGHSDKPIFADIHGPYPDAIIPKMYTFGGGLTTTGSIIDWLINTMSGQQETGSNTTLAQYEEQAALIPPGCEGLIALGFFQGNRTPLKDSRARGVMWGLTLRHTPAHLLRAFYEANAFAIRHILLNLQGHGYRVRRVSAGGGLTQSRLVMQILADVCGWPICLIEEPENTALGAAIWAGLGAGLFDDYAQATQSMVHLGRIVEPNPEHRPIYDFYFDIYLQTYQQLRDLMHTVVDFEAERINKEE